MNTSLSAEHQRLIETVQVVLESAGDLPMEFHLEADSSLATLAAKLARLEELESGLFDFLKSTDDGYVKLGLLASKRTA